MTSSATGGRLLGIVLLGVLLALAILLSLTAGARPTGPATAWAALTDFDPLSADQQVIRELRLPRTLLGLLVGAALGLSGAVLQGVTRNPLADPSLLGIHAGAALAVVIGIFGFGLSTPRTHVWCALLGAGGAMLLVHAIAAAGRDGATPVKLALAGAAVTAALMSVVSAVLLLSPHTLDQLRFWQVGALAGRDFAVITDVAPFLVLGMAAALAAGPLLDGLAMGEDMARALGQRVERSRLLAGAAAVVLAGAATAAAGPIAFVGLTVPHASRALVGPSYRWILPYSLLLAPILLLGADVAGRLVAPPGEVQVGVVTAALGAPVFIALVRGRRLAGL